MVRRLAAAAGAATTHASHGAGPVRSRSDRRSDEAHRAGRRGRRSGADLVRLLLEAEGFTVMRADSAEEALELARRNSRSA